MTEVKRSTGFFRRLAMVEALLVVVLVTLLLTRDDPVAVSPTAHQKVGQENEREQASNPAATATQEIQVTQEVPNSSSPAPATPAPATQDEPPGIVVFGQVRDTDGKPLKARVKLVAEDGKQLNARSDEHGLYSFSGVEAGTFTSRVDLTLYLRGGQTLTLTAELPLVRHDIVLTPSVLLPVRLLTPDGRSIAELDVAELGIDPKVAGLAVLATPVPVTSIPLSNRTHVQLGIGRFHPRLMTADSVQDPPQGAIGFLEVRGGYPFFATAVLRQTPLASVEVKGPLEELTLVVTPESIRENLASATVRLVDAESGEPLTQGRVVLGDLTHRSQTLTPDEQGLVRFLAVPPGLLILAPQFEGYEENRDYFRLEPSQDLDLGTLALHRQVTVSGQVSVERGRTIDVQFRARFLDRMTFPQPLNTGIGGRVQTKDGSFSLGGLGRGRHLLVFRSKHVARTALEVDTSKGDVSELSVSLLAGTAVTLKLNGNVMQSLLWQVLDPAGRVLVAELFSDRTVIRARLNQGVHRVRIYEGEALLNDLPFEVGSEPLILEFEP